jgi:hypothetical protein
MQRMKPARLCETLLAMLACLCSQNAAQAADLSNWQGAQSAPTGFFSDVTWFDTDRVYAGYDTDSGSTQLSAKLFTVSGAPGSAPPTSTDIGLVANSSIAVSIENDRSGGFFATATESLPGFESRSYIYESGSLGSPVAVIGPAPGNDPNVNTQAITNDGLTVGTIGASTMIVSDAAGATFIIPYPDAAKLLGVDSRGTLFAGSSERVPGGDMVATIFDANGTLLLQDSVAGEVWDVEGRFAVGTRIGRATYWVENNQGVWEHHYLQDPPGTPLNGELRGIDHHGRAVAGGFVGTSANGRAVAVELRDASFVYLEDELGLAPGTLHTVHSVDVHRQTNAVAFAVEGVDFSGWDVTAQLPAQLLPGPGAWVGIALLLAGIPAGCLSRSARPRRSNATLATDSRKRQAEDFLR